MSSIKRTSEFESGADGAVVRREQWHIDLLITHRNPNWAVVIENKIRAGDQPQQLVRYHDVLVKKRRFEPGAISILYLTPDGRQPSRDSIEQRDENGKKTGAVPYETVSYADDVLPWLLRCQQLSYDDPSLRESIAQYRSVVERMTGHPLGGPYMERLTDLCFRNLPVLMDLTRAAVPAQRKILSTIWAAIQEDALTPLGGRGLALGASWRPDGHGDDRIENMLPKDSNLQKWQCSWHCLRWPFRVDRDAAGDLRPQPALCVEINDDGLQYGVRCRDENRDRIEEVLIGLEGDSLAPNDWWPWMSKHGVLVAEDTGRKVAGREMWAQLARLANDDRVLARCAKEISTTLVQVRETLRGRMPELFDDL